MNKPQEHTLLMFQKVVAFIGGYPELTADTPEGRAFASRVAALESTIATIQAAGTTQVTATAESRIDDTKEPELKRLLVVHLNSIAEVARGLRKTVPGISVLKMPSTRNRNLTFVAQATAFAQQGRIYESTLAEHGLPADSMTQLDAAITAYRSSIVSRNTARTDLTTATKGIAENVALGKSIVTGMSGVIKRTFDGRKDVLAGWQSAKRVRSSASSNSGLSAMQPMPTDPQPIPAAVQSLPAAVQSNARASQPTSPAISTVSTETPRAA